MMLNSPELSFTSYLDKLPPAELDAERKLLGILLDCPKDVFIIILERINVDVFASEIHQKIYRAMLALYKQGREISLITIVSYFNDRKQLANVGGHTLLAELFDAGKRVFDPKALIDLILDKYLKRCLISFGNEAVQRGFDDRGDVTDILSHLKKKFEALQTSVTCKSKDEKDYEEFKKLRKAITDIELNISDPAFKAYKIQKLAQEVGKSARQLEHIYLKSLCNFSEQPRITIKQLREKYGDNVREWLLHGFLPKATTVLLHAEGGCGKTKLGYEFVYNLAKGTSWSGYPTTGSKKVLIYQTDESPTDMKQAFEERGFTDDMEVQIRTNWTIEAIPVLLKDIEEFQPDLIIIDSLTSSSRYSTFSENDVEYARPLLEMAQIAREKECTFLILHHTSKEGKSRGTGAIVNSVSEVWSMKRDTSEHGSDLERLMSIEKSRSRAPATYRLRFEPEVYSWHCMGVENLVESDPTAKKTIMNLLCSNRNTTYEAEEISHDTGIPASTVRRVLRKLAQEGAVSKKKSTRFEKAYCYFVARVTAHPPDLNEQTIFPSTTGDTELTAHPPKQVSRRSEQTIFPSTTGDTELTAHSTSNFSDSDLNSDFEKPVSSEQSIPHDSHSKDSQLIRVKNLGVEKNEQSAATTSKEVENVKQVLNLEVTKVHTTDIDLMTEILKKGDSFCVEKVGTFGTTRVDVIPKKMTRKNTCLNCRLEFTFPDNSTYCVGKFKYHSNGISFKKLIDSKTKEWENSYLLQPRHRYAVKQLQETDGQTKYVWIEGCVLKEVPNYPMNTFYKFDTPNGERIKVAGEDEFRLME